MAVSADGSVIVGNYREFLYPGQAIRWTESGGREDLGNGFPWSVSGDGSVIVGESLDDDFYLKAVQWTQSGKRELGPGVALDVSNDGKVVVGWFQDPAFPNPEHAFRWTENGGMMDLGRGHAFGVSADGSFVVGNFGNTEAFLWTIDQGMMSLKQVATNRYGIDLTGWHLSTATDITPDARVIIGIGHNPSLQTESWRLTLGGDFVWKSGNGNFSDSTKWQNGLTPWSIDSVIFSNVAGMNTVTFTGDTRSADLVVRNSDVTFDLDFHRHAVGSGVVIADAVGAQAKLTITNGYLVSGTAVIGAAAGSTGSVVVQGYSLLAPPASPPGSTWNVAGDLNVGGAANANAELRVEDGGAVYTEGTLHIGTSNPNDPGVHLLTLASGLLTPAIESQVRVHIDQNGKLQGAGVIRAPLTTNDGNIELDTSRRIWDSNFLPRPATTGYEASLLIDGDFYQSNVGTISVTGLSAQHVLQPSGTHSTAILVTGAATLDGTLKVGFADGYTPNIGDRFAIVTAKEIVGTIAHFDNAVIGTTTDRFLGLNYRQQGGPVPSVPVMEVVTLAAPRVLHGTATSPNLVFITHGTNANADDWVTELGYYMALDAGADWQVATFDWRQYAGGSDDDFSLPFDPFLSANNGINIGESLARWYAQQNIAFESVQLLGHSSGSWLVDSMADAMKARTMADQIHLTLFDAFDPPRAIYRQDGNKPILGETADFTSHYFHRYQLKLFDDHDLIPYTNSVLPNAVNFDLTKLAEFTNPFSSHAYPYIWYLDTAKTPENAPLGFALSKLYSGIFPTYGNANEFKGMLVTLDQAGFPVSATVNSRPLNVNNAELNVTTGHVQINPDGSFSMQTASPVILTSLHEINFEFYAMQFDFRYLSDAPGLLSVYLDDEQVFGLDSSDLVIDQDETISSGWIWLTPDEALHPGDYAFTFRLDNLTFAPASVLISNLRFMSLMSLQYSAIPEPSSLTFVTLGALVTGYRTYRRRRNNAVSEAEECYDTAA